jgi:hypothetical protein
LYNNFLFAPPEPGIFPAFSGGAGKKGPLRRGCAMTQPNLDPDEVSHQKEILDNNYHDEELEIQNDEEPGHRSSLPLPSRKAVRRPPPRKRYYQED